jgi:tetratricopeptide (TPR) repeat protein
MKKLIVLSFLILGIGAQAQSQSSLFNHYQAYYEQMKKQADIQGIINALTHLNVLQPDRHRLDTLAYVYASNNQHLQALNTIGIETDESDTDLSIQVKASSLKALNQPKRAIAQFEILLKRNPSPFIQYDIADLKVQIGDNEGALKNVELGLASVKDDMQYAFYERQQPYQVPLKAAFIYLEGLISFNTDKNNIDLAIQKMDEALQIAPNFNLASLSKQALESRKTPQKEN